MGRLHAARTIAAEGPQARQSTAAGDPHAGQPVLSRGAQLESAKAAVVLLHGRGAEAGDMLELVRNLPGGEVAYLAPQAGGRTWYPHSGFVPIERNEPWMSSAFGVLDALLARARDAGIPDERVVIGGFSQGACLASEYAARHPRRYGGLFVLSGALMGPPDSPRDYPGSLARTPVFVAGCDGDSWVSEAQLRMTAEALQRLGAEVGLEIAAGGQHTIRGSELQRVRAMIEAALAA